MKFADRARSLLLGEKLTTTWLMPLEAGASDAGDSTEDFDTAIDSANRYPYQS